MNSGFEGGPLFCTILGPKIRMDSISPNVALVPDLGQDAILQALVETPYSIDRPRHGPAPFVFASPHSGRTYPPSFIAASRLEPADLRRSEDAFVDELFAAVPNYGATLIKAHFPRAYVDVNRAEFELDPHLFDGPIPHLPTRRTARVSAGLGVIPRVVREGTEIYRHRLPVSAASFRLESFYRPYHQGLSSLLDQARTAFGFGVLIDCHSMPPLARGLDIVVGDCHGESAATPLTEFLESSLRGLGFTVGRNSPYAGGYATSLHGRPRLGLHALQLEINRGLYMDERRIEKSAGFADCQALLTRFVARLLTGSASVTAHLVADATDTARVAAQ